MRPRGVSFAGFTLLLFGVVLLITVGLRAHAGGTLEATSSPTNASLDRRTLNEEAETELLLVFIASTTCNACWAPPLPELVRNARNELLDRAADADARFSALGIAVSSHAAEGIEYLERFDSFDEVVAGGYWLNTGVLRFVLDEHQGPASVPQIIVVERDISVAGVQRETERVLLRRLGVYNIQRWVEHGAPVTLHTAANR